MTEEQQRIAIAEACGWRIGTRPVMGYGGVTNAIQYYWEKNGCVDTLPDYLNNLNAMHEAENVLTGYPQRVTYYEILSKIVGYLAFEFVRATASQRAEAFLRTINKWTTTETTKP